jgi:hypothetical protein
VLFRPINFQESILSLSIFNTLPLSLIKSISLNQNYLFRSLAFNSIFQLLIFNSITHFYVFKKFIIRGMLDNKRLEQVAETFSFYSRSGGNQHQAQAVSTTLLRLRL